MAIALFTNVGLELSNWIINAFNGEWLKVDNPVPVDRRKRYQAI